MQIKKCAAKLIFEVDENNADTNDEALADYISSPSPSAIQEEEEEVDYPSKRRRRSWFNKSIIKLKALEAKGMYKLFCKSNQIHKPLLDSWLF